MSNHGQTLPLLEQSEQIFAYGFMADAAKRSIDAIRFVDALLIGLMAAQAAILAIYLERLASADAFAKSLVWVMDWALVLCALTLSSTIAAKRVLTPTTSSRGFLRIRA